MVEILRSRDQTGPLWWRFSSAIVALYSLLYVLMSLSGSVQFMPCLRSDCPVASLQSQLCNPTRPIHFNYIDV